MKSGRRHFHDDASMMAHRWRVAADYAFTGSVIGQAGVPGGRRNRAPMKQTGRPLQVCTDGAGAVLQHATPSIIYFRQVHANF